MYEWNNFFIDNISRNNQINLKKYDSLELNKLIKSYNNAEFDYSYNVNEIPVIEEVIILLPVFKVENVNFYKKADNSYDMAKYSIELNFFKGKL